MGLQALRNTFSGARGALFAAPVAAGLALTSLAASANDAYAQDTSTPPQPVVTAQEPTFVNVPMRDSRGIERDGIQALAARASKDGQQIVVLYGPNAESFNEVKQGLENVLNSNKENGLRALIVASGAPELAYYADGQLTESILNPAGSDLSDRVEQQIEQDFQRIKLQGRDQIAQANVEALPVPETN